MTGGDTDPRRVGCPLLLLRHVSLPSAAFNCLGAFSAGNQAVGQLKTAVAERLGSVPQILVALYLGHVVLHVLSRPTSTVGDKRKLREGKAQFAKEHHHLTGDRLNVVLATRNYKAGDFVANQYTIIDRDLVLNTVHPFDHLEVERTWCPPADRSRDQ